ncbi:MAG: transcription elongation factor GreA [Marinifilaceae bacterium]
MGKISYVTQQGLDNLKAEIDQLQNVERPTISKAIGEAIDKGDISENAEYDAAKDAQGMLEAKISQLKGVLATCRVIDESQIDTSKVQMLNKVTIKNRKTNTNMTYSLVSDSEADLKLGKLSINTPIGKALMGKVKGDIVEVKVPAGLVEFEIIDITL